MKTPNHSEMLHSPWDLRFRRKRAIDNDFRPDWTPQGFLVLPLSFHLLCFFEKYFSYEDMSLEAMRSAVISASSASRHSLLDGSSG